MRVAPHITTSTKSVHPTQQDFSPYLALLQGKHCMFITKSLLQVDDTSFLQLSGTTRTRLTSLTTLVGSLFEVVRRPRPALHQQWQSPYVQKDNRSEPPNSQLCGDGLEVQITAGEPHSSDGSSSCSPSAVFSSLEELV